MKFGELIALFADKLKLLKFEQWDQPFSFDDIPANIVDHACHITLGQISGSQNGQQLHDFRAPITIRLLFKGYREPLAALVSGMNEANGVLASILSPTFRLSQSSGLKNITPVSVRPLPFSRTNESGILVELVFDCLMMYKF